MPEAKIKIISGDLETVGSIVEMGDYKTNPATRLPTKELQRYELIAIVEGRPQFKAVTA